MNLKARHKLWPLINPEFSWFITARILFIAGLRMTPVLLGWRLYEITGSKLALGMLGCAVLLVRSASTSQ